MHPESGVAAACKHSSSTGGATDARAKRSNLGAGGNAFAFTTVTHQTQRKSAETEADPARGHGYLRRAGGGRKRGRRSGTGLGVLRRRMGAEAAGQATTGG
jgi:hypothetical protein